jgi:predicted HTH domain antitoxin
MPRAGRDREGFSSTISLSTWSTAPGRVGFGQEISAPLTKMPRGEWAAFHKLAYAVHHRCSPAMLHTQSFADMNGFWLTWYNEGASHDNRNDWENVMSQITLTIPDESLAGLAASPDMAGDELRMLAAVKLFELKRLSSGAAARLAGISRVEFLKRLGSYGVAVFDLTDEEFAQETRLA